MINKKKFKVFNRFTILVFCILVFLFIIKTSYSFFHSDASGVVANKIAFYVVDSKPQSQTIKIGEVKPDGQDYSYDIEVSNFKNDKVSEVDLDYTVQIITSTNIPVDFKLYSNDGDTNIIGNKEIVEDDSGMYFFKYSPQVGSFTHGIKKTDKFTLVINFPDLYNDALYQDLIESVEVTVDAKQV